MLLLYCLASTNEFPIISAASNHTIVPHTDYSLWGRQQATEKRTWTTYNKQLTTENRQQTTKTKNKQQVKQTTNTTSNKYNKQQIHQTTNTENNNKYTTQNYNKKWPT